MSRLLFSSLLVLGSLFAVSAHADPLTDLRQDAASAEAQSRDLLNDIRASFSRSRDYPSMSREAAELQQLAIQLRHATRVGDPNQIDSLIHSMDNLTAHLTQDIRRAGQFTHGRSHDGNYIARAEFLANSLHDTLNHMDEHVDSLQRIRVQRPLAPVSRPTPSPGFSIGGRNFQFNFGR